MHRNPIFNTTLVVLSLCLGLVIPSLISLDKALDYKAQLLLLDVYFTFTVYSLDEDYSNEIF